MTGLDGKSLTFALEKDCSDCFLELAIMCKVSYDSVGDEKTITDRIGRYLLYVTQLGSFVT